MGAHWLHLQSCGQQQHVLSRHFRRNVAVELDLQSDNYNRMDWSLAGRMHVTSASCAQAARASTFGVGNTEHCHAVQHLVSVTGTRVQIS